MIDPALVLSGLPSGLRDELLTSFKEITSNYLERRWEPSELNGGKFCEIVYSILLGSLVGPMPLKATKPANMVKACLDLEKIPADPSRVGDRSLRIMIPRVLPFLYEIRNNRGVGHVGGDVSPNHMDAEAVQGIASWVMAELVRIFHGVTTKQAELAVDALVERRAPHIWEVEGTKRVLDSSISAKDQTLLLLHDDPNWVDTDNLVDWIEYSNPSVYRSSVLKSLHKARLIEYDIANGRAKISPKGAKEVEQRLLKT